VSFFLRYLEELFLAITWRVSNVKNLVECKGVYNKISIEIRVILAEVYFLIFSFLPSFFFFF